MKLEFKNGGAWASRNGREIAGNLKPDEIKKIAVIRHAAIGDMVAMRPFLVEARRYFPNAFITLSILKSYSYGAPEELVDRIHIIDKEKRTKGFLRSKLVERIRQAKRLGTQDIIFNLADSNLSYTITLLNKAKLKIGYPYRIFKRIFCNIATLRSDFVIETESMLHQLNILGVKHNVPYDYGYIKTYAEPKDYIVYFPGASTANKCWNKMKFTELIKKMSSSFPDFTHVVLRGVNNNEQFNEIINPLIHINNVTHENSMPLEKTIEYLGHASLVISNDTGIRNMAISVNTATVGIFFATGPFRYWPRHGFHDVVFNPDYSSPDVTAVFDSASSILQKKSKAVSNNTRA